MDSIPGITAVTPTPASTSTPSPPAAPADAGTLPLETIMQRELAYYEVVTPALKPAVQDAKLDTGEKRLAALGDQLRYITNRCTIGSITLEAFIKQHPDVLERGRALMAALPAPDDAKFTFGSLAYQTMLTNAAFPDNRLGPIPREHSALFLMQATDRPAE